MKSLVFLLILFFVLQVSGAQKKPDYIYKAAAQVRLFFLFSLNVTATSLSTFLIFARTTDMLDVTLIVFNCLLFGNEDLLN